MTQFKYTIINNINIDIQFLLLLLQLLLLLLTIITSIKFPIYILIIYMKTY